MNAFRTLGIPAAAFAMALVPTAAAPQPIEAEGAPHTEVSYADLDLGSPSGVGALQGRIRGAARRLCMSNTGGDLEERMARRTCFIAALASTRPQVEQAIAGFGRIQLAGRRAVAVAAR